ncbi:hypothetical protein [Lacisediminihabitans changchengi]|uniref:Uncharacterized protein n=1 Tax=Lacisediminihabitans changchengi TaxID=2787634 RepID=A0A934SNR9_9MICO|nr:hypothetical protein [Lacisediminihabitans changchengi]MBK4346235.1 hypothetical protein [Lacisediminihabitans changchengi]
MTNSLTTRPGRTVHHEHLNQPEHVVVVRRVGLLDRAALHLGVALVTWSRRPLELETRERRANRAEQHLARLAREREAERLRYLCAAQR